MKRKNIDLKSSEIITNMQAKFDAKNFSKNNLNHYMSVTDQISSKRIQAFFYNKNDQIQSKEKGKSKRNDISSKRRLINPKGITLNKMEVFDLILQKYFFDIEAKEHKSVDNIDESFNNAKDKYDLSFIEENLNVIFKIKTFTIEDINHYKIKEFPEFNSFPLSNYFKNYQSLLLNEIQKICFEYLYKTNEDFLLALPYNCGKSQIIEFAIAKALKEQFALQSSRTTKADSLIFNNFKIIYILQTSEKCQEKYLHLLNNKSENFIDLKPFSLELIFEKGSINFEDSLKDLSKSSLIFTSAETLEKLINKNNKFLIENYFYESISLIIYDSLNYIANGAINDNAYEKLINRINFYRQKYSLNFRTIGISARINNLIDIASFLKIKRHNVLFFPKIFDRTKIETKIYYNEFEFNIEASEKKLIYNLHNIITDNLRKNSRRNTITIICSNSKNTKLTCELLKQKTSKLLKSFIEEDKEKEISHLLNNIKNKCLAEYIKCGIAFDDAALFDQDRHLVKFLFEHGLGIS